MCTIITGFSCVKPRGTPSAVMNVSLSHVFLWSVIEILRKLFFLYFLLCLVLFSYTSIYHLRQRYEVQSYRHKGHEWSLGPKISFIIVAPLNHLIYWWKWQSHKMWRILVSANQRTYRTERKHKAHRKKTHVVNQLLTMINSRRQDMLNKPFPVEPFDVVQIIVITY